MADPEVAPLSSPSGVPSGERLAHRLTAEGAVDPTKVVPAAPGPHEETPPAKKEADRALGPSGG